MERTRASLSNKLEALEGQVLETVQTATEGVAAAVEGVKSTVETVSETVTSVTETLDVSKYFESHPWIALGTSVGVGFMFSWLFGGSSAPEPQPAPQPAPPPPAPAPAPSYQPSYQAASQPSYQAASQPSSQSADQSEGWSSELWSTATTGVASLAVNALAGTIRHLATQVLPQEMHNDINSTVDSMITKLGVPVTSVSRQDSLGSLFGAGDGDEDGQKEAGHGQDRPAGTDKDSTQQGDEDKPKSGRGANRNNGPRSRVGGRG